MPRINRGLELTNQFNSMVPQAQSLGIRVRPRVNMHGNRSRIAQMVEDLRNQIAQYNVPVSISGSGRTFGTEFEFYLPRNLSRVQLAAMLTNEGIQTEAEGYNHNNRNWWKLITDGSLQNYSRGSELVSPVLVGEDGIQQVRKALRILVRAGCRVSTRCGFHVHVGVEGEQLLFFKNILQLYQKFDAAFDSIMAPSRRNNHYCAPVRYVETIRGGGDIQTIEGLRQQASKFRKLNILPYWRQKTVEFRHHQGTLDPLKADMWIRLVLRIVEAASKKTEPELLDCDPNLDNLLNLVAAEQTERNFFQGRVTHFAGGGTE